MDHCLRVLLHSRGCGWSRVGSNAMKLILLLIAERFLIYMDKKIKASDEKLSIENDEPL